MTLPQATDCKQAQIPPGTPPRALGALSGTIAPADALIFSVPCPHCGAMVSLPWCHLVSAVLDRLDALETGLRALQALGEEGQP